MCSYEVTISVEGSFPRPSFKTSVGRSPADLGHATLYPGTCEKARREEDASRFEHMEHADRKAILNSDLTKTGRLKVCAQRGENLPVPKAYLNIHSLVEAMEFTDEDKDIVFNWVRGNRYPSFEDGKPVLKIDSTCGSSTAKIGDFVVKISSIDYLALERTVFKSLFEEELP
jgi:hypothetical protein